MHEDFFFPHPESRTESSKARCPRKGTKGELRWVEGGIHGRRSAKCGEDFPPPIPKSPTENPQGWPPQEGNQERTSIGRPRTQERFFAVKSRLPFR